MSMIYTLGVMMLFLQGINLMTLLISAVPDFTQIGNVIRVFWPGALALVCILYHFLVENKRGK